MDYVFIYPLFLYLLIILATFSLFKFRDILSHHFPIFLFLLFISPSIINLLMHDYYNFQENHFSALNFINRDEFLLNITIYFCSIIILIFFYKIFTLKNSFDNSIKLKKLNLWVAFSELSEKKVFRYLLFITILSFLIGMYIRFGLYNADQFYAPLKGDSVENIARASYGRSQVLETIFLSVINLSMYISLEYRKKWPTILFFLYFLITSLYVGSKAGFIVFIFWVLVYLFFRRIIKFRFIYIFIFLLLLLPGFILGDLSRTYFQGVELDGPAKISLFGWVENISKRDPSIAQTVVMINDPNFYSHLKSEYLESFFGLAVPSFIWPDKPITPGYAIAELFGFGVQSAAPGWLGGFMFLFGHIGIVIGPIIVAAFLAIISNKLSNHDERPSLHYPIIYMIFIELSGFFMDGGYHSFLPTFIALALTFILLFVSLVVLNGKFPKPPL